MPRLLFALALLMVSLPGMAVEEPAFTVERRLAEDVEIRRYVTLCGGRGRGAGPGREGGRTGVPHPVGLHLRQESRAPGNSR
jgi:hypothetical protein